MILNINSRFSGFVGLEVRGRCKPGIRNGREMVATVGRRTEEVHMFLYKDEPWVNEIMQDSSAQFPKRLAATTTILLQYVTGRHRRDFYTADSFIAAEN